MTHTFDTRIAERYGVEAAVVINNHCFWIQKNISNNKNFHEGKYWTYNSAEALSKLFPYFSPRKVKRILDELVSVGALFKGCFNENKYDRTCWYAVCDEILNLYQNRIIHLPNLVNGFDKDGVSICQEPQMDLSNPTNDIQIINPDNKQDSIHTYSDVFFEKPEIINPSTEQEESIPPEVKEIKDKSIDQVELLEKKLIDLCVSQRVLRELAQNKYGISEIEYNQLAAFFVKSSIDKGKHIDGWAENNDCVSNFENIIKNKAAISKIINTHIRVVLEGVNPPQKVVQKKSHAHFEIPIGWEDKKTEYFFMWLDYKVQRKDFYTEIGLKSLIKVFSNKTLEQIEFCVTNATSSMWQGINWETFDKIKKTNGNNRTTVSKNQSAILTNEPY